MIKGVNSAIVALEKRVVSLESENRLLLQTNKKTLQRSLPSRKISSSLKEVTGRQCTEWIHLNCGKI